MRIRWEALPVYSRPERTPLYGPVLLPPLGPDRIRVKLEDEHAYPRTLDELKQSLNIRWEQDSDVSWLYDPDGPSKVIKTDRKAVRVKIIVMKMTPSSITRTVPPTQLMIRLS